MPFIQYREHVSVKPVSIERDANDVVIIEGVRYAGELFRTFAEPSDTVLYAMRRDADGTVRIVTVSNVEEARTFFEEGAMRL